MFDARLLKVNVSKHIFGLTQHQELEKAPALEICLTLHARRGHVLTQLWKVYVASVPVVLFNVCVLLQFVLLM